MHAVLYRHRGNGFLRFENQEKQVSQFRTGPKQHSPALPGFFLCFVPRSTDTSLQAGEGAEERQRQGRDSGHHQRRARNRQPCAAFQGARVRVKSAPFRKASRHGFQALQHDGQVRRLRKKLQGAYHEFRF